MVSRLEQLNEDESAENAGFVCAAQLHAGRLLLLRGDAEGAANLLEAALVPCAGDVGESDHEYGRVLEAYAEALLALDRVEEARPIANRALDVLEATLRDEHPELVAARVLAERAR